MAKGTIKVVIQDKGYGFIQPEDRGKDVFFHASKVKGPINFNQLQVGMTVDYEATSGQRGMQATDVQAVNAPQAPSAQPATPPYRFLNPYNFVQFLAPPQQPSSESPKTALGMALQKSGVSSRQKEPDKASRLLSTCAPPPHDRHVGITGKITCLLEAVTPLFVSDSENVKTHKVSKTDKDKISKTDKEHKSYRFFRLNGDYALPASSLRGMIRSVFEAVTNSCVGILNDARLSYHLPPEDALKLIPGRIEKQNGKLCLRPLTGTTPLNINGRPQGPQYAAWVPCYLGNVIRPSRNLQGTDAYAHRNNVPLNGLKHGDECWAIIERIQHPRRRFEFWNATQLIPKDQNPPSPKPGERIYRGFLCITNQNIENKHDERFFFHQDDALHTLPLKDKVIEDYKVLIKDYQDRHHDKMCKRKHPDQIEGDDPAYSRFIIHSDEQELKEGSLVYARLSGPNTVEFIVPVSVPRVAYEHSIADLLPYPDLETCKDYDKLCPACRVFGWVHQLEDTHEKKENDTKKKRVAYAGRIKFSHGEKVHIAGTLEPVPLAILSSPKPTTTRFYLRPKTGPVPQPWQGRDADFGYETIGNILRGRKVYRHHGVAREQEYRRAEARCDDQNRTVRDALLAGSQFKFTVDFENLAPIELGALLWVLEMDGMCFHRLGFAKPLGFGSVTVKVTELSVLDPGVRYSSLTDSGWKSVTDWRAKCIEPFKVALASYYNKQDFESLDNVKDLRSLLGERKKYLPIHYPRTARIPDPSGKNFEWFVGNNKYVYRTLDSADDDKGLPLIQRDGFKSG